MLADEMSKTAFDSFVSQKLTGKYEKEYEKKVQYFDDQIIGTRLTDSEFFIDCGAFQGETAREFVSFLNRNGVFSYTSIVEIEPDDANVGVMQQNLKGMDNVNIIHAGVYDKKDTLFFDSGKSSSSKISDEGNIKIDVISIDESVHDTDNVTFIKMDIEGSELMALKGAENTIRRCHPKLAISVYHKPDDLVEIPKLIRNISDEYSFYIRNYSRCGVETVLYAV